jgi:hypothetical protein
MRQRLKEGWTVDKVEMTEVDGKLLSTSTLTKEQVTEKIVNTAKVFEEHIPAPVTRTGQIAKKAAKSRTRGDANVPARDILAMAKRIVRS